MESFHLSLNTEENYWNLVDVKNWIRLAVSISCLKEISLDIGVFIDDTLTLPNELFSSQNLHTITVSARINNFCIPLHLQICANHPAIKCVFLRVLNLKCVFITEDVFHNLLFTCGLLEKIRLWLCGGLKNVKVKNLLRLTELDIFSMKEEDDRWEINNVPRLCSFCYHSILFWMKPIPFQIDSYASVTQLRIEDVILDGSFFNKIQSKFSVLESLTIGIDCWKDENMVITSASLKWLTLDLFQSGPMINVEVNSPRLLSFVYIGGYIHGLLFRTTTPNQIKLTFYQREDSGHLYFLKMREALNSSSKFDIKIRSDNLSSVVPLNIDIDDLRRGVLCPFGNVQLTLETSLDEHAWEQSRFFDALFLICHPSYIKSSYLVIRKMMEGNTNNLKEVLFKNPHNEKWEALTSYWISLLHTFPDHLFECKLNWSPHL